MPKRTPDVVVISDVHLGTYGCHATELLQYLKGISPRLLILNGDIIDIWNFSKRYFPAAHMEVIGAIMQMAAGGTRVVYITGNHDELLRKYSELQIGNLQVTDKLVMEINGQRCWIFHGDVFDATTKGWAKVLARLGGKGYDMLILLNRFINYFLTLVGREKMSLSKRVKAGVKKAVSWVDNFEQTAAELAIERGYDYVICGHIHQPQHRKIENAFGEVQYLNSGDWVENLTALEYNNRQWTLYRHGDHIQIPVVKINHRPPVVNVLSDEVMLYVHSLNAEG